LRTERRSGASDGSGTRTRTGTGLLAVGLLAFAAAPAAVPAQTRSAQVATTLTIFAGTEEGLWRSGDWGHRWEKLAGPDGAAMGAVRSVLALGPRVYVAADGGLFLSDDFGQTWEATSLTIPVSVVLPSRYPLADPTLFAGTSSGLLRSPDAGRTFAPTAVRDTYVHRLEWPGPALVVATARGVLVSEDAATTVRGPGAGLPAGDVRAMALSSFFIVDPVLFAAVGPNGVHRSSDGGRTWTPSGLAGQTVTDLVWLGPFLYAAGSGGLFRSEDAGKTWTPLADGLGAARPTRILFPLAPDSGAEAFLGTDQGIFRTADGGTRWMPTGMKSGRVLALATFPPPEKSNKKR
jgi:ligand-binding sensor domain-containing protein